MGTKLCSSSRRHLSIFIRSEFHTVFALNGKETVSISVQTHLHLRRVWYADRGRTLLRTPGPVPFGLAYVLLVETNPFPNLSVFYRLCSSNIPRYFLDFAYRYIDDVLSINTPEFENYLGQMYPDEPWDQGHHREHHSASYLNLLPSFMGWSTSLFHLRQARWFQFPHHKFSVPALTPPGHLVSPLVCRGPRMSIVVLYCWSHSDSASVLLYLHFYWVVIFRQRRPIACLSLNLYDTPGLAPHMNVLFWGLSSKLLKQDTLWNAWNRHSRSFMIDTGILFSNMQWPSYEC